MHLQPHTRQADPELWRAVHERFLSVPQRNEVPLGTQRDTLHGMPADRLAMAASGWPLKGCVGEGIG
ncbi:MAG: hypothetical protein CFE40_00705 [Burkholderiales bacterium PBB1]|nr:MAG: hypothetical protein CFE40_00705 [Burkholderiales bacterium PBB1]